MAKEWYTLVQHSAHGYAGDPTFARAVEERSVEGKDVDRVVEAGGLLLDGYTVASAEAERVNYPAEVQGLIPRVRGTFARVKVDGLRVYVPAPCEIPGNPTP